MGENGKMRRFFVCIEEESFFIEREAFSLCEGGLHDTRVSERTTPGCQYARHPGVIQDGLVKKAEGMVTLLP